MYAKNITNIKDILSVKGIWYERELDTNTGLYEFTGNIYVSIPEKNLIINCNTGESESVYKHNDAVDDDILKRPKYIYICMYEINLRMF